MPQTWLVVCCHACSKFQVDQEKKAKKWQCKICGEKQSLQRIYARSHSAKDCRQVVQRYNTARGQIDDEDADRALRQALAEAEYGDDEGAVSARGGAAQSWLDDAAHPQQHRPQHGQQQGQFPAPSRPGRWLEYADEEENDCGGCTVAVPERAVLQKRGNSAGSRQQGCVAKRPRQQRQSAWSSEGTEESATGLPATEQQQPLPSRHCPLRLKNGPGQPALEEPGCGWQVAQQQERKQQTWQAQQLPEDVQQPWQQQARPPVGAHLGAPHLQAQQQRRIFALQPGAGPHSLQTSLAGATGRWGNFVEEDAW